MMTPARGQTALPRGRWAPLVGIYPPLAPAGSPLEQLLAPPPPAGAPAFPALPTAPPPPPVVMESPAQGMQIGGGADGAPGWGTQPSIPSPNQNLASVVDAALTGVGMLIGGPMAMLGAIPAMAALSTLENPQPTLGLLGAIGQLMGYPTVGQMVEDMVEGMLGGDWNESASAGGDFGASALGNPQGEEEHFGPGGGGGDFGASALGNPQGEEGHFGPGGGFGGWYTGGVVPHGQIGTVHGGEGVLNAAAMRYYGRPARALVAELNARVMPRDRLRDLLDR